MKALENSKYIGEWDESMRLYRITRKSDGLRGGFIEGLHNLSEYGHCWVYDNARVRGNAIVRDNAIVGDSALVTQKVFNLVYDKYIITGTDNHLRIGCKQYTYEEWWNFPDEEITKMDKGALEWWKKWKPILQAIFNVKE